VRNVRSCKRKKIRERDSLIELFYEGLCSFCFYICLSYFTRWTQPYIYIYTSELLFILSHVAVPVACQAKSANRKVKEGITERKEKQRITD
jgi:hypothetical protein